MTRTDQTLQVLDDTEQCIVSMQQSTTAAVDTANKAVQVLDQLDEQMSIGVVDRLSSSIHRMNQIAASYTHDVTAYLASSRVQSLIEDLNFPQVDIDAGGYRMTAAPVSRARAVLSDRRRNNIRDDCLEIRTDWEVSGAGIPVERLTLVVLARLVVDGSAALGVLPIRAPRFLDDSEQPADPFGRLPLLDSARSVARQRFQTSVNGHLATTRIETPAVPGASGALTPHAYLISEGTVVLIDRQLPPRRKRESLRGRVPANMDVMMRLHRGHVEPQIRAEVQREGADVDALEFRRGWLFLRAIRLDRETRCHITVTVTTQIEYRVTLETDLPWVLFADGHWLRWNYRINIRRCWPICGRVMNEARAEVYRQVPRYFHLQFAFADLREVARRSVGWFDEFGVSVAFKSR